MNSIQNGKARDLQKPFPGCMGRMISMFDLTSGVAGAKLITEKAHRDGSPIRRNQPDVVKAIDPVGVRIEDKPIASELRSSSKKSGGTAIKMLIAQEMSKDMESKQMPPNVIARLMGLDALPNQQSVRNAKRSSHEGYSRNTLAGTLRCYRQQEDWCYADPMPREIQSCDHEKEYKDVYEVRQTPSKTNRVEDRPSQKGRYDVNLTEKRMALVRQKFIEAKHLATDERLIRSKEFQDALEVLSSNRDLFLKFLDEPNSLFSKHIHEFQTVRPLSQPRCITVLKPAITVESQDEKQAKEHQYPSAEESGREMNKHHWSSRFTHQKAGDISQPTRIVVLKPSPGQPHEIKDVVACPVPSPKLLDGRGFDGGTGTDEAMASREVAKEVSKQMQESVNSNLRNEALLSNGYVGDDSSFNRSENDCIEVDGCDFSDSEIATPTSRHYWDCTNRLDSPHSSFSRASYSPESSVIREAKKRLSERWALVASNGISHEQRQERRSSSTLGEMLAIPEVEKEEGNDGPTSLSSRSCGRLKEEVPDSLSIGGTKDACSGEKSPRYLSRSKSVPVSSSIYESTGMKEEVPDSHVSNHVGPKEVVKSKSGKSSFKGKVSSLFFSKIKKPDRGKSVPGPLVGSDVQSGSVDSIGKRGGDISISSHDSRPEESKRVNCKEKSGKASTSVKGGPKGRTSAKEQDEPSPPLVIEAPFEDDLKNNAAQSSESSMVGHPQVLSRSPLIESLARSLSRDHTRPQTSLPKTLKHSTFLSEADEEQDQFVFVQKLLSSAGLDNKKSSAVFAQWHSLDSPLNPMLLDEFLGRKEEEAKCRARRSNQKLLFDCVTAALLDIGHSTLMAAYPWASACGVARKGGPASAYTTEVVWGLVRDWSSAGGKWLSGEAQNSSSLVVDRMVKEEVAGMGWVESMWSEIDEFGKEIGGKVLDELVEEALIDLTGGCL